MNERTQKIVRLTFILFFIILALYGVIEARSFLYPIALAVLFASLLYPVANFFETKLRFPRILANLVSIILGLAVIGGVVLLMFLQIKGMMSDLPSLKQHALEKAEAIQAFITNRFGVEASQQQVWLRDFISNLFDTGSQFLQNIFRTTTSTAANIILMPVYIFFMLLYRDKLKVFLIRTASEDRKENRRKLVDAVSHVAEKYMGGVSIVVAILMVVNSTVFYFIGLEYALFLGMVAAMCNFIPYFGTILGFSIPMLFSLLTEHSPEHILGIAIAFVVVQFTENNILTPSIVGSNVRLNPFVIILSLIIGAMVWGLPGMLVVIPVIAVLKIYFDQSDSLRPFGYLIGAEGASKHTLSIKKIKALRRKLRMGKSRRDKKKEEKKTTNN
jgi:predicted PurR-regulated permease PerM